jgi:hypothetical protein
MKVTESLVCDVAGQPFSVKFGHFKWEQMTLPSSCGWQFYLRCSFNHLSTFQTKSEEQYLIYILNYTIRNIQQTSAKMMFLS